MGTDQQRAGLPFQRSMQFLGADHLNVEEVEPAVEQVDAVMDGAGKAQDMAEAIGPFGPAPERTLEVGAAGASGRGGEQYVIGGDAGEDAAPDPALLAQLYTDTLDRRALASAEQSLRAWGLRSTIVVFGSARTSPITVRSA